MKQFLTLTILLGTLFSGVYSEETGWMDHLGVSIKPINFNKWLSSAF